MAKRVAALVSRSAHDASERAMREVATSTGAELFVFEADGPDDYPAAFAAMRSAGAEALAITATPYFYRDAPLLARLALEAGLPTVCEFAETAHSGCFAGLWPGPSRATASNGALRREDIPRHRTGRSADRTADPLPICRQPEDRQGSRPHRPAIDPGPRRRGC